MLRRIFCVDRTVYAKTQGFEGMTCLESNKHSIKINNKLGNCSLKTREVDINQSLRLGHYLIDIGELLKIFHVLFRNYLAFQKKTNH